MTAVQTFQSKIMDLVVSGRIQNGLNGGTSLDERSPQDNRCCGPRCEETCRHSGVGSGVAKEETVMLAV